MGDAFLTRESAFVQDEAQTGCDPNPSAVSYPAVGLRWIMQCGWDAESSPVLPGPALSPHQLLGTGHAVKDSRHGKGKHGVCSESSERAVASP